MGLNQSIQNVYKEAYNHLEPMIPLKKMYKGYDREFWRDISPKYALDVVEGVYQISTFGRVYNKVSGTFLSPYKNPKGYLTVSLQCTGYKLNHKVYKVHRLVMLHFEFRPDCYLLEIDHKDTDKTNNHISNLEWVTPQENTHRAIKSGLRALSCSTDNGTLLTDDEAHNLYKEVYDYYAFNEDFEVLENIANKYNVSTTYALSLFRGSIRPYIAKNFYDKFHYEKEDEEAKRKEYYGK